ncbi:MAG: hypothetical protein EXR71_14600 [Myxococcales bacterium]|nr:hypothetical protein [Myxococcales bacterium]
MADPSVRPEDLVPKQVVVGIVLGADKPDLDLAPVEDELAVPTGVGLRLALRKPTDRHTGEGHSRLPVNNLHVDTVRATGADLDGYSAWVEHHFPFRTTPAGYSRDHGPAGQTFEANKLALPPGRPGDAGGRLSRTPTDKFDIARGRATVDAGHVEHLVTVTPTTEGDDDATF